MLIFRWIVLPIKKMSDRLHAMRDGSGELLAVPTGHENSELGRLVGDINELTSGLARAKDIKHDAALEDFARATGQSKALGGLLAHLLRRKFLADTFASLALQRLYPMPRVACKAPRPNRDAMIQSCLHSLYPDIRHD